MFDSYELDTIFMSSNPSSKKIKAQQQSNPELQKSILPSCLNNLHYPTCMIENHQQQPLSMLCIDQKCEAKGLICALCEGDSHYEHLCMPLKVYLNEVYGHLYQQKVQEKITEPVIQKQIQSPVQKGKSKKKNKGKNKLNLPQIPLKPREKTNFKAYDTSSSSSIILYFAHKIEENKTEVLRQISRFKENIVQKLDYLETSAIKYYNKLLQQISSTIPIQNPILHITKMMENIRYYRQLGRKGKDETNQKQLNYTYLCHKETTKLKKLLSTILKQTNINQKFTLSNKMQGYYMAAQDFKTTLNKTFLKNSNQYLKNINENILQIQLKLNKGQNYEKYATLSTSYQFSSTLKGHKFILRNQNKVGQQTGMESSGQRLMLMQPSLPKLENKYNQKSLIWALKIVKLAGWIGVGISLKNIIVKANYHFNYTALGHGNYFISNNAYCWSHSLKQYNSASKSFSFTTGDTIYMKYFPNEKKLKFVKNNHESQIALDVVDPPADDQYVPSVNMCSNGDTIEVIDDRIQIVL